MHPEGGDNVAGHGLAFADRLQRTWYAPHPTLLAWTLRPLSWLFRVVAGLRRKAYRARVMPRIRLPVPVVVVGNIVVGGTGKTPLVLALAAALRERGYRPGIVSRGHGRRGDEPRCVRAGDDALDAGDEPLILAAAGVPVWVARNRAGAALALLAANPDVDVIIADDGLQHYALERDVEVAVVDAARGIGNGLHLPAGPLRESPSRLRRVDAIVELRRPDAALPRPGSGAAFAMSHQSLPWRNVADPARSVDAAALRDLQATSAVAVAGIAHPQRFFDTLADFGFSGRMLAFPDHYAYSRADVAFPGAAAILMTEKDAVKCRAFADMRMWMLPVRAQVDSAFFDLVVEKLRGFQVARDARLSGHQGPARS